MERDNYYDSDINKWKKVDLILAEMRHGSEKAFSRIFLKYFVIAARYADRIIDNKAVSKEIASDALLVIWNNRIKFTVRQEFESFLFVCIKNKCIDYLRREKRKSEHETDSANALEDPKEYSVHDRITPEIIEDFYNEVKLLPSQQKQVIEMALDGLTTKEIANLLNISDKTVRNHKSRALDTIQSRMAIKVVKMDRSIPFLIFIMVLSIP